MTKRQTFWHWLPLPHVDPDAGAVLCCPK